MKYKALAMLVSIALTGCGGGDGNKLRSENIPVFNDPVVTPVESENNETLSTEVDVEDSTSTDAEVQNEPVIIVTLPAETNTTESPAPVPVIIETQPIETTLVEAVVGVSEPIVEETPEASVDETAGGVGEPVEEETPEASVDETAGGVGEPVEEETPETQVDETAGGVGEPVEEEIPETPVDETGGEVGEPVGEENPENPVDEATEEVEVIPTATLISPLSINEPETGIYSTEVEVRLSHSYDKEVKVFYSISGTSADNRDLVEVSNGEIIFEVGSTSSAIEINILGDGFDENDETFRISLIDGENVIVENQSSDVVIIDEDETPIVKIENFDGRQVVIEEGIGRYEIIVSIDKLSPKEIVIPYLISGIASEHQDYSSNNEGVKKIIIPAEQSQAVLSFDMLPDSIPESGESLIISLESAMNAIIDPANETYTLVIAGQLVLNDTGITSFYNLTGYDSSPNGIFPDQDASFGADAENQTDFDGHAAFSFTKLNESGNPLPDNVPSYRCLKDNRTGLVWEVKGEEQRLPELSGPQLSEQIFNSLRDGNYDFIESNQVFNAKNYKYFWHEEDENLNGGSVGTKGAPFVVQEFPLSENCAFPNEQQLSFFGNEVSNCSTSSLVKAYNSLGVCGITEWEMPTIEQLRSIENYQLLSEAPEEFILNTAKGTYISNTPSASETGSIWCIDTRTSEVQLCNKQDPNYVRLVSRTQNQE